MKPKLFIGLVLLVLVLGRAYASYSETRQYLLGDMDGFVYEGPGSVDDVYLDPLWQQYFNKNASPDNDLDQLEANQDIGFSFVYPLEAYETVVSAVLTLGLRATDGLVTNDIICLDGRTAYEILLLEDLGWQPILFTGINERSVNLDDVAGEDFISYLQDGQFNVQIRDDVGVDYAILDIEVVPEPATLSLLAIGAVVMIQKRRKLR